MFIVHKKGLKLDGKNPTLLYAYGGFNISLTPYFSTSRIILLENGGVFALANLRGGGEFGEEWHQQGMLMNKQNVFDDFFAAAEYLFDKGYTSKKKLAIEGGSNGGLLVGACITQRPELYRVAFPAVGVMDMLKYHKFTVGWGWTPEYGSSEDSKEMFEYLYGYSPYHNIKDGTKYPATMITTADHDDRVVPAHSFKFAARMQAAQKGKKPILIRIETKAGHGAGKPTSKIIEEQADKWAFMFYNMKYSDLYPDKK
jgi:prolyl oligopeptidase